MESKFTSLPADILEAAKITYELEKALSGEPNEEALSKAIEAGIRQYESRVTESIAAAAEMYANEFLEGDETTIEGATLHWFAEKLRGDLSPTALRQPYSPQTDDVAEVTVTGVVTTYEDVCGNCNHRRGNSGWSVVDDNTGEEYHYMEADLSAGLRVRLLHRADDPLS